MSDPPEGPVNGGGLSSENVGLGSKRQRRPSVRLGDIGDQPATRVSYDQLYVRRTKQWTGSTDSSAVKHHHHRHKDTAGKSSRSRPLTNLGNGNGDNNNSNETLEIDDNNKNASNLDLVSVRRAKRGGGGTTKRVRSNLVPKHDEETNGAAAAVGSGDEGSREFDDPEAEGSQSPVHSQENPAAIYMDLRTIPDRGHDTNKQGLFSGSRKSGRSREHRHDEAELDGPSDTDARGWKCGTSAERNEGADATTLWSPEDGVRMWLNGLGLPQYAPVFEIHEVDEQVLPQLTLDDLKDMGINAVGSRRKLYSAIQKLAKGFS